MAQENMGRLTLPELEKEPEARKARYHFLMETEDGGGMGVWENELPAFLRKYGQEGQAGNSGI